MDHLQESWYEELSRPFDDFDYTPILNTPIHGDFNDLIQIFVELFQLKMASLGMPESYRAA